MQIITSVVTTKTIGNFCWESSEKQEIAIKIPLSTLLLCSMAFLAQFLVLLSPILKVSRSIFLHFSKKIKIIQNYPLSVLLLNIWKLPVSPFAIIISWFCYFDELFVVYFMRYSLFLFNLFFFLEMQHLWTTALDGSISFFTRKSISDHSKPLLYFSGSFFLVQGSNARFKVFLLCFECLFLP